MFVYILGSGIVLLMLVMGVVSLVTRRPLGLENSVRITSKEKHVQASRIFGLIEVIVGIAVAVLIYFTYTGAVPERLTTVILVIVSFEIVIVRYLYMYWKKPAE